MLYSRRYPPRPIDDAPSPSPEPVEQPQLAEIVDSKADLTAALIRLAELQELYESQGWKPIKAIGDALGVEKHPDGWEHSLLAIIAAEFSAEIAEALQDAVKAAVEP